MDFSFILFVALLVTGGVVLLYKIFSKWMRRDSLKRDSFGLNIGGHGARSEPIIVEYARALFPVLLIVFVLRSFIIEPFRIPSGSMLPSLHIGDFILVDKFSYGIRLPVINKKIFPVGSPARGDVMVFRYPIDPKLNFIKRVIGLPGDVLTYKDKQLTINGKPIATEDDGKYAYKQVKLKGQSADQLIETIDDSTHKILLDDSRRSRDLEQVIVPPGHYFVMGDNRDHSNDSRYWRFVPEANVVGRAFFIWFSWKGFSDGGVEWSRIGLSIE